MARKKLNQKQTADFFEEAGRLRQRRINRDRNVQDLKDFYARIGEEMPSLPLGPIKRLSPRRVR